MPPGLSNEVRFTVTLELFHPAALGGGANAKDVVGGVMSGAVKTGGVAPVESYFNLYVVRDPGAMVTLILVPCCGAPLALNGAIVRLDDPAFNPLTIMEYVPEAG